MFQRLVLLFYFLTLFCGLAIPSDGSHGILSPKSVSFLGLSFFTGFYLIARGRISTYQLRLLSFTLVGVSFLLIWLFFGAVENDVQAFDQFKLFMITLLFGIFSLYIVSEQLVEAKTIIKSMIYINFSASLLKILVFFLSFIGFLKLKEFLKVLGIRYMTMDITDSINRLQTSVDIITPFLIFFVLQLKLPRWFRYLFCAVSLLSVAISFSRLLIFIALLSIVLHVLTLKGRQFLKVLGVSLLFVCVSPSFTGVNLINTLVQKRFYSKGNTYSDNDRVTQYEALMEAYDESPFIGNGMGSSTKYYYRDKNQLHSYEVQWVAFLMQFGFVGLMILLVPVIYIGKEILAFERSRIALFVLYLFWLGAGFTNPFLISLTSGIVYTSFLLMNSSENSQKLTN